ncbi:hypothetical protein A8F94_14750 [Bacillus sp. FJAT-27225]|uniref:hypothetical protein n=1 Tax=Bacillus sp. FJAT-27225 TaxID=1743144 RepID=UPI00080C278B|nr:hypothetical protein [Bacillus sp. FJAT-27225]OCA83994.1 hypothetical protein A8F94_14750 [Bacillus sp. FJAT-27225]
MEVRILKTVITASWDAVVKSIRETAVEIKGVISGLPNKPALLMDFNVFLYDKNEELIDIDDEIIHLEEKLSKINNHVRRISELETKNEQEINKVEWLVMSQQDTVNAVRRDIQLELTNRKTMIENLAVLEEDLQKNQEAQKLYSLGSDIHADISKGRCPTCHQHIEDTLLPQEANLEPLDLNENIKYIKEQINAVKFGVLQSEYIIKNKQVKLLSLEEHLSESRKKLRLLKSELREDPRMPTHQDVLEIVETRMKIKVLEDAKNKIQKFKEELDSLQNQWRSYLARNENLPKEYFSSIDLKKLQEFEGNFKKYASEFDFSSVSVNDLSISLDKYTPTVRGFDVKFDSSASDHIRLIWAYICSLAKTGITKDGNHPGLIVLDEPGQQQMDMDSQGALYKLLAGLKCQVLVASSLKPSEIQNLTRELPVNIIDLGEEFIIKPLQR